MTRLDRALELVRVNSVSGGESALADYVAARLSGNPRLAVERVGDNVVARTTGSHSTRLIVAGHLDTVPGDPAQARIEADALIGLGACDMKGSLSVMLDLACVDAPHRVELTWVFYAREEIARTESGLRELFELRPDLVQGDVAVLGEPTGGAVEVGCQGTMRASVTMAGIRAHTARPFMGVNAIHRLGAVLARVASYVPRVVAIGGVVFTEQMQVVMVDGGVAGNVVPDVARGVINYRFAPDRSASEAEAALRDFLAPVVEPTDAIEIQDWAPAAAPDLDAPWLASLASLSGADARAKVGWTDVATFQEFDVPAVNFGAGDPLLAHHPDERVTEGELEQFERVLAAWIG